MILHQFSEIIISDCELLRMRPLRSSDRRRVSLVCRNSLKSVATKPNLRRKRFPSVSVKNFISPSAFGLWWNNYFHPDLWVALQKILHFLHPTATQGRTTKNTLFLCRAGWEHPRRKWRRRPPLYPRLQDLAHVDRTNQLYQQYHSYQFLESLKGLQMTQWTTSR